MELECIPFGLDTEAIDHDIVVLGACFKLSPVGERLLVPVAHLTPAVAEEIEPVLIMGFGGDIDRNEAADVEVARDAEDTTFILQWNERTEQKN